MLIARTLSIGWLFGAATSSYRGAFAEMAKTAKISYETRSDGKRIA